MTIHTQGRLFEGADWDFSTLQRIHDACEKIAIATPNTNIENTPFLKISVTRSCNSFEKLLFITLTCCSA